MAHTGSPSNEKIGRRELTSMMTVFIIAHAFLTYPTIVSAESLEAAWMEPLIGGILAIAAFLLMDSLFRKHFPGMDILEVIRITLGKWVARCVAVMLAGYFIFVTATIQRQFSENVISTVLPSTPILIISGVFLMAVCYVAMCGLEGIARLAKIFAPIIVVGILSAVICTINWWYPVLLLPFWGSGMVQIGIHGVTGSSLYLNILLLTIIYPHAQDHRDLRKVGVNSTVRGMLLLAIFLVGYHMVYSPEEAKSLTSSMYSLSRLIHIGRFIQRVESVYVFIWVSAAVVKMSITVWAAAYVLGSAFQWSSHRPVIPALGLIALAGGLLEQDVASMVRDEAWRISWGWAVTLIFPIVALLIGALFGRKKGGAGIA